MTIDEIDNTIWYIDMHEWFKIFEFEWRMMILLLITRWDEVNDMKMIDGVHEQSTNDIER